MALLYPPLHAARARLRRLAATSLLSSLLLLFGAPVAAQSTADNAAPDTAPSAASADAAGSGFRLSGYGTLGIAHADVAEPYRLRRDALQPPPAGDWQAALDSRLGLQANWQLSERVEAVAQAVLRPRAHAARAIETLEWAFLSLRPQPDLTLRVGRLSPDLFLLADYRNIAFAYPWVRPSPEFYGWMPLFTITGVDAARQWDDAGGARWRLRVGAGSADLTTPGERGSAGQRLKTSLALSATLTREAGPLTLKASLAAARTRILSPGLDALQAGLQQVQQVPAFAAEAAALAGSLPHRGFVTRYGGIGAQYDSGRWLLLGELSRVGSEFATTAGWQSYASVARRFDAFTAYAIAGRTLPAHDAVASPDWRAIGAQPLADAAASAYNSPRRNQSSLALGLRWDLHPQAALTLQWDRVAIRAHGGGLWAGGGTAAATADVAPAALDFVF